MTDRRNDPRPGPRTGARPREAAIARAADAAMARERAGAVPPPRRLAPPVPVVRKARPDPGPIRIALGLTGMATASALISAFLSPATGANAGVGTAGTGTTATTVVAPASDQVRHVTRYVQLQPGQTAPPDAVVRHAPAPKPRVVMVQTRQSGG